jgi:aminobenzoyl-glutamate utilization protein B
MGRTARSSGEPLNRSSGHTLDGITRRRGADIRPLPVQRVGVPLFTEDEQTFARALQLAYRMKESGMHADIMPPKEPNGSDMGGGSSDVGNVSWVVPTTPILTACWPGGVPAHSWGAVACTGSSVGLKGMRTASKVIAASVIDTLFDPSIIAEARKQFLEKTGGKKYVSPIPKDRRPPMKDVKE